MARSNGETWDKFYSDVIPVQEEVVRLRSLVKEAIELFNDGLNIGLGWVARAERLLDGNL